MQVVTVRVFDHDDLGTDDLIDTFQITCSHFFGKCNGSRTWLVHTFGRAGTNLGRDGLRCVCRW